MIGLVSSVGISASASAVGISGVPTWAITVFVAVVLVVASLITVRLASLHSVFAMFAIALEWGIMIALCLVFNMLARNVVSFANVSRIEGHYGVSDMSVDDADDVAGLGRAVAIAAAGDGEPGTSASDVSPVPISPSASASEIIHVSHDRNLLPSDAGSAYHVGFKDAKGASRAGYVVVSGNHATLYVVGGAASKPKSDASNTARVYEYAGSPRGIKEPAITAYDYGDHR